MTSKSRVAIPMPLIILYSWGDYAIAGDIYKVLSKAMEYNNAYLAFCFSVVNSRVFTDFSIFNDNSGLSSIFSSEEARYASISPRPQDTITEQHSIMNNNRLIREVY